MLAEALQRAAHHLARTRKLSSCLIVKRANGNVSLTLLARPVVGMSRSRISRDPPTVA